MVKVSYKGFRNMIEHTFESLELAKEFALKIGVYNKATFTFV